MKIYRGKVEIYNESGRVHYPIEVQAGTFPVAVYRFAANAIKIYRTARKGQRVKIKSLVVDISEINV